MIAYEIDPSLHAGAPPPAQLDDGFSPPHNAPEGLAMATHPVEPEQLPPGPEPEAPNPTRLPVEPEFGPALPPALPEDPGVTSPKL
jgi:hypothetical protein